MTDPTQPSTECLEALVERALTLQERGETFSVEELCDGRPELTAQVRAALGLQADVDQWTNSLSRRDRLVQRVLGERYRVIERIGAGAMGAVYRAHDGELKRDVAVKVLQPHLFGAATAVARLAREAEVIAGLRHPNVVTVFDRGETVDGQHYIVMELLSGVPMAAVLDELHHRVSSRGFSAVLKTDWVAELLDSAALPERGYLRQCARWIADLAGGLETAHQAGIYHRDVKPSNVFITADGRAVLLDFGIASRDDHSAATADGTTLGTPRYMPPEQARGVAQPSPKLDVYSLAATLYHAVTGRPPYEGDVHEVLTALQREDPPPADRYHPGLPSDLLAIIECGMARDAARRYATAAAFEEDLRAFLDHRPVTARRRSAIGRVWDRLCRARALQAALGAAALVVVVTVGWSWSEAHAASRRSARTDLWCVLPPTLTLGRLPVIDDSAERERVRDLLDRSVALDPDDVLTRAVRAAFRTDHDDVDGAAADEAVLAQSVSDGSSGAHVLAGYRAMRDVRRRPGEADELYRQAIDHFEHAEPTPEVRALVLLASLRFAVGRRPELKSLHDEALMVEGSLARKSTLTRYLIGTTLGELERYRDAVAPLEYVVAHAPRCYPALTNLTINYVRLTQPDDAERTARQALVVRPTGIKALSALAWVLALRSDFEEALATAESIPDVPGSWVKPETVGFVQYLRGFVAAGEGDTETARGAGRAAKRAYRAAIRLSESQAIPPSVLQQLTFMRTACEPLVDGQWDDVYIDVCRLLAKQPSLVPHLLELLAAYPLHEIKPEHHAALTELLLAIAAEHRGGESTPELPVAPGVPQQEKKR